MPAVEEFQKGKFVDPIGIIRVPPRSFIGKPQSIDDENFNPVGVSIYIAILLSFYYHFTIILLLFYYCFTILLLYFNYLFIHDISLFINLEIQQLAGLHINTNFTELIQGMRRLSRKLTSQEEDIKQLVKDNFDRYEALTYTMLIANETSGLYHAKM